MKALVVYYSMSGNARWLAGRIADLLGAETLELVPQVPYPSKGFAKYFHGGGAALQKEAPTLQPYTVDLSDKDRIIFVTPVWAGCFAPPLRTFIKEQELAKDKRFSYAFAACSMSGKADKCFRQLKEELGLTADVPVPTLSLISPKDKKKAENEDKIRAFCLEAKR